MSTPSKQAIQFKRAFSERTAHALKVPPAGAEAILSLRWGVTSMRYTTLELGPPKKPSLTSEVVDCTIGKRYFRRRSIVRFTRQFWDNTASPEV